MSMEVSTLTVSVVSEGVTSTTTQLRGLENQSAATENSTKKFTTATEKASKELNGFQQIAATLKTTMQALGGAMLVGLMTRSAEEAIKMADAWQLMQARLTIATGSMYAAQKAQQGLFELSQDLRTPLEATAQLYTRLVPALTAYGKSSKDAMEVTKGVALALKLSGASGAEVSSVMLQFSQSMQAGRLNGAEFNAVAEGAPLILKALEAQLGKTRGELKKMGSEGKLTTDVIVNAIEKQVPKWEEQFATLPVTVDSAMTQVKNALTKAFGEINQQTGFTAGLAKSLQFVAQNAEVIIKIVGGGLVLAMTTFAAKTIYATAVNIGFAISQERSAKASLAAAEAELASAKIRAANATYSLEAAAAVKTAEKALASASAEAASTTSILTRLGSAWALLISPIGLTVAAIAGLVAGLYLARDEWVQFGDTQATVADWLKGTWKTVADYFGEIGKFLGTVFDTTVTYWKEALGAAAQMFGGFFSGIDVSWKSVIGSILMVTPRMADSVIAAFYTVGSAVAAIANYITTQWGTATTAITSMVNAVKAGDIKGAQAAISKGLSDTADNAKNLAGNLKELPSIFANYKPIETTLGAIGDKIKQNTQAIATEGAILRTEMSKRNALHFEEIKHIDKKTEANKKLAKEMERQAELFNKFNAAGLKYDQDREAAVDKEIEKSKALQDSLDAKIAGLEEELTVTKNIEEAKARSALTAAQEFKQTALQTQAELALARARLYSSTIQGEQFVKLDQELQKKEAVNEAELDGLNKVIEKREKILDLTIRKEWKKDADEIGKTLTDALTKSFTDGTNFFKNLWSNIKSMLMQKIALNIQAQISQTITGSINGQGAGGNALDLSSPEGWINAGKGLWEGAKNLFGFGDSSSSAATDSITNSAKLLQRQGADSSSFMSSISNNMGQIGSYLKVGNNLLNSIKTGEGWGKTIGGALGTFFAGPLGPLGGAIGEAIGGMVDKFFGGGGGPKEGGSAMGGGGAYFPSGWTEHQADSAVGQVVNSLQETLDKTITTLGGKLGVKLGIGYSADPHGDAQTIVSSRLTNASGQEIYYGGHEDVGRSKEELDAALQLESSRILLRGLKESNLPAEISKMFDGVDISTISKTAADALLADLTLTSQTIAVFKEFTQVMPQLSGLSLEAEKSLVKLAGGVDNFAKGLNSYYDNFYTAAEKTKVATDALTAEFVKLGYTALPTSREAFRALVESIDLSTEAGQKQYIALVGLSGAFAQLVPATEAAANGVQSLADKLAKLKDTANSALSNLEASVNKEKEARTAIHNDTLSKLNKQKSALDDRYAIEKAQIEDANKAQAMYYENVGKGIQNQMSAIQNSKNTLQSLFDTLQSSIDSLYGSTKVLSSTNYDAAQNQIDLALAAARAGGQLPTAEELNASLSALTSLQSNDFASNVDFMRKQLVNAGKLSELQGIAGSKISAADAMLSSLNAQLAATNDLKAIYESSSNSALTQLDAQHRENLAAIDEQIAKENERFEADMKNLTDIYENAKKQLEIAMGTYNEVRTLNQAMFEFNSAIAAYIKEKAAQDAANNAKAAEVSAAAIQNEQGKLEITAKNQEVIDTLVKTSEDAAARERAIAVTNLTTSKVLTKWDNDGMPELRDVA